PQAPLASSISKPHHAMNRIFGAHTVADGIGKDRAQEPDGACCGSFTACDARQSMPAGLDPCRGLALGDRVHEAFDILARDCGNPHSTEQWPYMPFDSPLVGGER